MGLSVVLGMAGGKYLDHKLDTTPILFWLGFALGVGAAIKSVVSIAKVAKKELTDEDVDSTKKN